MKSKYDRFNADWKNKPNKKRGVKFLLGPQVEQHRATISEYQLRHQKAVNHLVTRLLQKVNKGEITVEQIRKRRDSKWAKTIIDSESQYLIGELELHKSRQRRGAMFNALRLLRGYNVRNKESKKKSMPTSPPRLKHIKATYLEDGIIKHHPDPNDSGKGVFDFSVHGMNGKKYKRIEVDYTIPSGMVYNSQYIPKDISGYLCCAKKTWHFTTQATVPFQWAYEPVAALGFDLNKTQKWFITLSEPITWNDQNKDCLPHTKELRDIIKKLVSLNEEIKLKEIRSSQRRGIRRKVQRAHRKMLAMCMPYCEAILAHVVENKLMLCIDDLGCGARTGSFGQDKIITTLVTLCENRRIPFVLMDTPHTSKACNVCMRECLRPQNEQLICEEHGELVSHRNASRNIADWGWRIWNEGFQSFAKWKKANYKPLPKPLSSGAEHGCEQSSVIDDASSNAHLTS